MLQKTVIYTIPVVEVNIASSAGQILSSSNPNSIGSRLRHLKDTTTLRQQSLFRVVNDLIREGGDYEIISIIGDKDGQQQLFVQVVIPLRLCATWCWRI
jgi:hypothetical protein